MHFIGIDHVIFIIKLDMNNKIFFEIRQYISFRIERLRAVDSFHEIFDISNAMNQDH